MDAAAQPRRLVGAFVNTHPARCSIFESGAMVAGCIANSAMYDLHYTTLAEIDLDALRRTGRLITRDDVPSRNFPSRFDFWVFNWHFVTMAAHLEPGVVAALKGLKFTVVLELSEHDPLVHVPKNTFDGYLALDPLVAEGGGVFPFPRPLQGIALRHRTWERKVPVIGSFGFGTPGKGFELLVESVGREFERARIRINVPFGDYVTADPAVGLRYADQVARMCRRIAKPGIEVEFTQSFLTPEALIEWCHENDLNCFMYTRDLPGLSATTDQAILSGQPLLTLTNATFRHIHPYVPPYPITSFRSAIEGSAPGVARMQRDWSRDAFRSRFEAMLGRFGLSLDTPPGTSASDSASRLTDTGVTTVLVLHRSDGADGDILSYGTRFANALARSASRRIVRMACDSVGAALAACLDNRPDVVIALDHPAEWFAAFSACCASWRQFRVLHGPAIEGCNDFGARPPLVPFFTSPISTNRASVAWLFGFDDEFAPLHRWIARIAAETCAERIVIECAPWNQEAVQECVERYGTVTKSDGTKLGVEVQSLPDRGGEIIRAFAADGFVVLRAGGDSTARTEAICSLALCTDRAVMIDASAPLPAFGDALTIGEAVSLQSRIDEGISAQIATIRDFGEWVVTARWMPLLDGSMDHGANRSASELDVALALSGLDRLDDESIVRGLHVALLGREPDEASLEQHVDALWVGQRPSQLAQAIGSSVESLSTGSSEPGAVDAPDAFTLYVRHWVERMLALDDVAFTQAAHRAGLGLEADPDGLGDDSKALAADAGRLSVLYSVVSSDAARRRIHERTLGRLPEPDPSETQDALGAAWLRFMSSLDPEAFLRAACRICVGRPPRIGESAAAFADTGERWGFIETLMRSAEAKAWAAGTDATAAARRLSALNAWVVRHATPAEVDGTPEATGTADDDGGDRAPQARASPSTEPSMSALPAALPWRVGTVTWILVSTAEDGQARRLMVTGAETGATVVPVRWNGTKRRLEIATAEAASDPPALTPELCRRGEWLVVPSGFDARHWAGGLPEIDVLMAARVLGLGSACLFHGADLLASDGPESAPRASACERYMQALLHADLILPVSRRARNDLLDVFSEHQSACETPPVIKLALPIGGQRASDSDWSVYWRKLRVVLDDATEQRDTVAAVYLLDRRGGSATPAAEAPLAKRLRRRGVLVRDVVLEGGRLRFAAPKDAPADTRRGKRWLVVDGFLPKSAVSAACQFAHAEGAQVMVIDPATGPEADFTPYLHLDRVILGRDEDFRRLNERLLESRERLPVAEERFALIENSAVLASDPRPPPPPRRSDSPLRIAVLTERSRDPRLEMILDKAPKALARGSQPFSLIVCSPDSVDKRLADRFQAWHPIDSGSIESIDAALHADVALVLGGVAFSRLMTDAAAWRGVPVLVDSRSGLSKVPGVMTVDFDSPPDVETQWVRLLEARWRRTLQSEASCRMPRTDQDRADEILRSMALDDPFRSLQPLCHSGRASVYRRFPALKRRPLLSVCISTYNRAGWLAVNLANLMAQLGHPAIDDVEVVVVDNAATDTTPHVVRPYLSRADFHYHRNERNVGMLGNLAVTAQRARGEYIWIIGDDDLTQPEAVSTIVRALRAHPGLAMVYLNYGYTSVADPASVTDIPQHLKNFNVLEPEGPDALSTVAEVAANNENFYTAIYACVFQRVHALRAFCQDTSGRPFSTMLTCIPTAYYALLHMGRMPAYWIGKPLLVVNSNVSWAQYGPLFDLEQLPRAWDFAERAGAPPAAVDARRSNRLWLVEMMWRDIFENDGAGNAPWFSASRVLTRLKHLPGIDARIPELRAIYERAHARHHPAASMPAKVLFGAWPQTSGVHA